MKFRKLKVAGAFEIIPARFQDSRGYFSETFRSDIFRQSCSDLNFVQDNESLSVATGTLRGLHFQTPPFEQGKLVRCLAGQIFDVVVDLRRASETFGHWESVLLSAETGNQIWIPPGFAHGFCTLEPNCILSYKVTKPYSRDHDTGILWNDPVLNIDWPKIAAQQSLSPKDQQLPFWNAKQSPF